MFNIYDVCFILFCDLAEIYIKNKQNKTNKWCGFCYKVMQILRKNAKLGEML